MKSPPSSPPLSGRDATKESVVEGESRASSGMCLGADKECDTKVTPAMGSEQPRLIPGSLPPQSSPGGSLGSAAGSGWLTLIAHAAPMVAPRPKVAGTVLFWKEPSPGAKRRAKAAAAAKAAAVSAQAPILASRNLMSEAPPQSMIQLMLGTGPKYLQKKALTIRPLECKHDLRNV